MAEHFSPQLHSTEDTPEGIVQVYTDGCEPPRYVRVRITHGSEGDGHNIDAVGPMTSQMLAIDQRYGDVPTGRWSTGDYDTYFADAATLPVDVRSMEIRIRPGTRKGMENKVAISLATTVLGLLAETE